MNQSIFPPSIIDTRLPEFTAAIHACITAAHRLIVSVARTVGVGSAIRQPLTKLATCLICLLHRRVETQQTERLRFPGDFVRAIRGMVGSEVERPPIDLLHRPLQVRSWRHVLQSQTSTNDDLRFLVALYLAKGRPSYCGASKRGQRY
jgi:hypothetical protein